MAGASVSFRGVAKRYDDVDALVDFELDIAPGEFMTFLGPSGSGKTTALNILAGFTDASAGDVLIDGRSVVDLPPERRNVGMVFQSYSLFPHMTVFENVAFPLRLRRKGRGEIERRVGECLEMVRLADLAGRMPKELSGGQRQRVAFARAVAFEPPVLLMDEPLGALDLKLRQAMQIEVKRYHEQLGCTIVFVTHDQGEALGLSDRIAVMGEGRIRQVDRPDSIYDRPNSRYVAEFIGRTNILSVEAADAGSVRMRELGVAVGPRGELRDRWCGTGFVSIRPEKIHRVPEAGDAASVVFPATIEEVLFLGDIVQYRARVSGGAVLDFQEHRGPETPVLRRNSQVNLGFHVEDAYPVSGEAGSAVV